MGSDTRIREVAGRLRTVAEAHPFEGDWPPEGYWVHFPGPNGRGGVHLAFTLNSAGAERLLLKTEGLSPPKNRTIRRWCAAFWGDFRAAEWQTEGNTVLCGPKAPSRSSGRNS